MTNRPRSLLRARMPPARTIATATTVKTDIKPLITTPPHHAQDARTQRPPVTTSGMPTRSHRGGNQGGPAVLPPDVVHTVAAAVINRRIAAVRKVDIGIKPVRAA